jgi:vacuolar-type H+-ATPase subunit H
VANETITHEHEAEGRASELAGAAKDQARDVADDARQEVSAVVSEAGTQARNLVDEARTALRHQASDGTTRAAGAIDDLGSRFRALAQGDAEGAGDLRRYADQMGERLATVADRVGERGVDGIVDDVQRFGRRRPGLFLAAAVATGFVAGRLFRGAQADASSSPSQSGNGEWRPQEPTAQLPSPGAQPSLTPPTPTPAPAPAPAPTPPPTSVQGGEAFPPPEDPPVDPVPPYGGDLR